MASVRAKKSDRPGRAATAEKIREAAEELFCLRGYEAVSVGDIAERAGVNKALVFYHFESKAGLFDLVLERYYLAHKEALASAFAADGALADRLHRVVDAYLDFMAKNRRYAALIGHQMTEPETHPLIRKNLEPLFRFIGDALGEATPADGPLAARQFYVTFSGMVTNYFTYAPLLGALWGGDPMSRAALDERRAHVHWLVDAVLARLDGARPARKKR